MDKIQLIIVSVIGGMILRFVKPTELGIRQVIFRGLLGMLAIPGTIAVDAYFGPFDKWLLATIASLASYMMYIVVEKIEDKFLPKYLDKKVKEFLDDNTLE